ncbi:hypothetical protein PFISCL1PPCAC_16869, partial [Pristionchus fissidentatus]
AETLTARAAFLDAIEKLKEQDTLQGSSDHILKFVNGKLKKLKKDKHITHTSNIKYFLNSLELEAFEEKEGAKLNFEFIRSFVHHEIDWQINLRGGDAGQFEDIDVCSCDEGATRCLLWNAGSNCLDQLNDLLRLKGLLRKIKPDILLLNEITLTKKNQKLFISTMKKMDYKVAISIAPSYKPGGSVASNKKNRTQRGSAILVKKTSWRSQDPLPGSIDHPYEIAFVSREKPACHLLCCYISGAKKAVIDSAQDAILAKVGQKQNCIIAGDLNCKRESLKKLEEAGFVHLLDSEWNTNWGCNAKEPKQIDHVFAKAQIQKKVRVHKPIEPTEIAKSGHRPIVFDIYDDDQKEMNSRTIKKGRTVR